MAIETTKPAAQTETQTHHSALEELYRDERRPALILLGGLVIAVIFFALGIMVGRWMSTDDNSKPGAVPASTPQATPAPVSQAAQAVAPASSANAAASPSPARSSDRRYSLLIATFNTPEEAQPLIKRLEDAGYKDVRTSAPGSGESQPRVSILVGRYTREEADQIASRLRATGDARLRYVRVIEE